MRKVKQPNVQIGNILDVNIRTELRAAKDANAIVVHGVIRENIDGEVET